MVAFSLLVGAIVTDILDAYMVHVYADLLALWSSLLAMLMTFLLVLVEFG